MSTTSAAPALWPWRQTAIIRILGSFVGWFGFALSFGLLFLTSHTVLALGGYCASGGPYEIAVECPDNVVAFTPLSIFGGLAAVALAVFFAQGFGFPLIVWAWPTLFVGLGYAFLQSFFSYGDITGIVIGVMFIIMGIVPLIFALRMGWRSTFLGTTNVRGEAFDRSTERTGMWLPSQGSNEATAPTAGDWALAILIPAVGVWFGWFAASSLWYGV